MRVKGRYVITPDGDWWVPIDTDALALLASWGWQSYSVWSDN